MSVTKEDVARQIRTFAEGHAAALDLILGAPDAAMPDLIDAAAKRLAQELEDGNEDTALALRWIIGDFPDGEPEFWSTPVGQEVFRVAGYGREVIPRPHVVHILGVSRQRVNQLEHEGVLTAVHEPAGTGEELGPVIGLSEESVRRRGVEYPPGSQKRRPEGLDEEAQEA